MNFDWMNHDRMNRITIGQTIEDYNGTPKKNRHVSTKEAENVLKLIFEDGLLTPSSFLSGNEEALRASLVGEICRKKRKSGKESEIANDYFAFLGDEKKHHGYAFYIKDLPLQLSPLERQLALAKGLHGEKREGGGTTVRFRDAEVAEAFLVSETTIQNDLHQLQDGIGVMDQKFHVEFQKKGGFITMNSTAHPLFLAPNFSQIIVLMEGLRKETKNIAMGNFARSMAVSIWMQLSDYAKNRILNVLIDKLALDRQWYEFIAEQGKYSQRQMFSDELSTAQSGKYDENIRNQLLFCYKDRSPCELTFRDDQGDFQNLSILSISNYNFIEKSIIVRTEDGECTIPFDDIIEVIFNPKI